MPYRQSQVHYDGTTLYADLASYSNTGTTDASGNATYYLTDTGLSTGTALFSNIILNSVTVTPISSSTIYLNGAPTISVDKRTLTVPIRQNSSLLGLGLIPFSTATAGVVVNVTVRGVLA